MVAGLQDLASEVMGSKGFVMSGSKRLKAPLKQSRSALAPKRYSGLCILPSSQPIPNAISVAVKGCS